jgi:hypothetical protein
MCTKNHKNHLFYLMPGILAIAVIDTILLLKKQKSNHKNYKPVHKRQMGGLNLKIFL